LIENRAQLEFPGQQNYQEMHIQDYPFSPPEPSRPLLICKTEYRMILRSGNQQFDYYR